MSSATLLIRAIGALLVVGALDVAIAGDRGPLDQDIQISLGAFFLSTDTKVRLDGSGGETGTDIDWEEEFDLADKDRFRLDAFWRFADRHKVRLMLFQNDRSGSRTLTRDISFGDTVYPVTTTVEASLDTTIVELAYEYAFVKRDDLEFTGSFGVHNVSFDARLRGDVTTPGGGGSVETEEDASTDGPLPVLGLRALWAMGGNFYLDAIGQFFYVEYGNYTGHIYDLKLGVTWFPTRNFGVGIAYNAFETGLDVDQRSFSGDLTAGYGGPMAFITAGF